MAITHSAAQSLNLSAIAQFLNLSAIAPSAAQILNISAIAKFLNLSAIAPSTAQSFNLSVIAPSAAQTLNLSAITPSAAQTLNLSAITPSAAQSLNLSAITASAAQSLNLSAAAPSTAQILNFSEIPLNFFLGLGVTQINCYYQNIAYGPKEDSYEIANSSITNQSSTRFGFLNMDDVLLTEGPDPTSNVIALAQGLFGSADLDTLGFFLELNVYFPSGPYNGSTLHIVGRDSPFLSHRELAVTGGTQYFRMAKGFVTMSTVFGNNSTMNATFEFNITVYHPMLL